MEKPPRHKSIIEKTVKPLSRAVLAGSLYAVTGTSHIDFEQLAHQQEQREEEQLRQELKQEIEYQKEQFHHHPELVLVNGGDPEGEAIVKMLNSLPDTQTEVPRVLREAIRSQPKDAGYAIMVRETHKPIMAEAIRLTLPESANAVVGFGSNISKEPWALPILEDAALLSPAQVQGNFRNAGLTLELEKSTRPEIRTLIEIAHSTSPSGYDTVQMGIFREVALLLDDIVRGTLTIEEAQRLAGQQPTLFKRIIEISRRPGHLASQDIREKLNTIALEILTEINRLHSSNHAVRFKSVEGFDAQSLYYLIVLGESEVATSTFNGLFDRMMKQSASGTALLEQVGYAHFRTFIKMLTGYGRLNDFLGTMQPDEAKNLLVRFIGSLEQEKDMLSQASSVADMIMLLKDDAVLDSVRELLKKEYTRVAGTDNAQTQILYGLLVGMYGQKEHSEEEWIARLMEKYKLQDIAEITPAELCTKDGKNVQRYFFYHDEDGDGQASYDHFISQYSNDPDWTIEDRETFIRISSKKKNPSVIMYANKPTDEEKGNADLETEMRAQKEAPTIIVHRGHSFHLPETLKKIPESARIVYLGSCGGYNNIDKVLSRAQRAHIFSTKGTGMMRVNDPLLKLMNGEIMKNKPIEWIEFWKLAQERIGTEILSEYVPPHRSISIFLRTYYRLANKHNKPE